MKDILLLIYWDALPAILQVIGVVLGVVLMRIAGIARDRWDIEIEARHREALQSAVMSGIRAALGRGLTGADAVNAAIAYTARSVPDALAKLDPDHRVLADLAAAKLREVIEKAPPILDLGGHRILPDRGQG